MKKAMSVLLSLALFLSVAVPTASAAAPSVIGLKEKYTLVGGERELKAHSGMEYVEEAYYAAPIVADLDGDGKLEVITAAYTLTVSDAATGKVKWQVNAGKDRSTPHARYTNSGANVAGKMFCTPVVKDVNGDGKLEIAVAYANGTVAVLNSEGYFLSGWPKNAGGSVWALAADDLDGDGRLEIIAGLGVAHSVSLYVYGCDGNLKPGWPQAQVGGSLPHSYVDGIYSNGISTGDLDGDGLPEIIMPTDNQFVSAFNGDGTPVMVSGRFQNDSKDQFSYGGKIPWSAVGFYEDYGRELKRDNGGWGLGLTWESLEQKGRAGLYRPAMSFAATRYVDVDGDGTSEVVLTAMMMDHTSALLDPNNRNSSTMKDARYTTIYILNQDHTRFNKGGYNWEAIPTNLTNPTLGAPLNQNAANINADVQAVPLVADVNSDGVNEILFNSSDGKVHCYSLKDSSKELAGWPYTLPGNNGTVYEVASEPVAVDLNRDGKLEIVFASWTSNAAGTKTGVDGSLYVLDGNGTLITRHKLHSSIYQDGFSPYDNGSYAAPAVADIDGDGQLEILVNTRYYGVCAYDVTPGQATQEPRYVNPNHQRVLVNGSYEFTVYTYMLNNENYIAVRDLAWYMTDALPWWNKPLPKALFDVSWNGRVNLVTGKMYAPYPGHNNDVECVLRFVGPQPYRMGTNPISVNGKAATIQHIILTDANGGDTTYYRLRDLAAVMGTFTVGWDGATRTATITTK